MSSNRTYINRTKTLIILLGIIIACLLTFNAKSFHKDGLSNKASSTIPKPEKPDTKTLLDQIGEIVTKDFAKKITSLN